MKLLQELGVTEKLRFCMRKKNLNREILRVVFEGQSSCQKLGTSLCTQEKCLNGVETSC